MAVGDIYKLVLKGSCLGEPTENVFYYRVASVGSGSGAENLYEAFNADRTAAIASCLSESALLDEIEVVCLPTPIDYFVGPCTPTSGTLDPAETGGDMPSWVVLSAKFNRNGPGTRYSFKRFSGLVKDQTAGNNPASAAIIAWAAALDVLCFPHQFGSWDFTPVQVKHPTPLGSNPVVNHVLSSIVDFEVGSQDTRKD